MVANNRWFSTLSLSAIVSMPAYSWRRSIRMYLGRRRQILIASFWIFWSFSILDLSETRKELLPYSSSVRTYILYRRIVMCGETPALDSARRTLRRWLALAQMPSMWFLKESRLSNSMPRNRASSVGPMTSLKRATLKFSSLFCFWREKTTSLDLLAFSLTRHRRHHPSSRSRPF